MTDNKDFKDFSGSWQEDGSSLLGDDELGELHQLLEGEEIPPFPDEQAVESREVSRQRQESRRTAQAGKARQKPAEKPKARKAKPEKRKAEESKPKKEKDKKKKRAPEEPADPFA